MSEVKVNKISPRTNCGTVTVGDSGDSVSVSAGVPVTVNGDLKSNALKATDGGSIISQSGTTITLGASGDTVSLASGASQTGFGRTGTVDWQTGSIKTATFTAANGEGYFANTSGGAFTMNLPAGTAGNIVSVVDYTNTFQTNALTVSPNGSQKIGGVAATTTLTTEGQSVTFVYVDDTEGWKNVQDSTSNVQGRSFISATVSGACNTLTTSGNCKIATFVGPGTFCVSSISTVPTENQVSFLVIGGGGGGGTYRGGGGGAGGFREFKGPHQCYSVSPLNGATPVSITATAFPITVGAGGPASGNGNNSVFSTITSAAGGKGNHGGGGPGGSGGGARSGDTGGTGNTPPVSPPQGTSGGNGSGMPGAPKWGAGGGGGAVQPGDVGTKPAGGNGGNGTATSITGSPVTRAGGGGGGAIFSAPSPSGGSGGGGPSPSNNPGVAGTANTGSGGGGANNTDDGSGETGGTGGSGIVVIRYKFQ